MTGDTNAEQSDRTNDSRVRFAWFRTMMESESQAMSILWLLLIGFGTFAFISLGLSTFSLFKGPVSVAYENTFGTQLLQTLPQLLLRLLIAAMFILFAVFVLRKLRVLSALAMRLLWLTLMLVVVAQMYAFKVWGTRLADALQKYDIVILDKSAWRDVGHAIGVLEPEVQRHSSYHGDEGYLVIRVGPRIDDLVDQAISSLRNAGYHVKRKVEK